MVGKLVRLAWTALALAALEACGTAPGGGGASSPGPRVLPSTSLVPGPDVVPAAGAYLGVYVSTAGGTPPLGELPAFETQIGRTVALTQHYYAFFDAFPGQAEAADAAAGRIPIESWDCQPPNAAVAAGNDDAWIRKRADALKAYGKPIFLRYMWEMNLPSSSAFRADCYSSASDAPNGVFSPAEFIAAWDRIRVLFAQEGATNVIWLWNPAGTIDPLPYYPGASEVDWVGFDKYDVANVTFSTTFAGPYGFLLPLGKPIMIGETGASATVQPAFFAAAVPTLQSAFPQVKAFVYFDSSSGLKGDWSLTPAGESAFAAMGADPYFAAKAP